MFRSLLRAARKPNRLHRAVSSEIERLEQRIFLSTSSPYSFDDTNGFNGNGITLNYSAYYNNNQSIKLSTGSGTGAEARTAFYTTPVEVGDGFQVHFVAQLNGSTTGGMTFTIENDPTGANARGSTGSGMGYMQIRDSAAITLNDGLNQTNLITGGSNPQSTVGATNLAASGITLSSGDAIQMDIGYAGTTLTVIEKDQTTGATATQTYTGINLTTITGSDKAYIGFTGGDVGSSPIMTASQWAYSDTSADPNAGINLDWPSNIFADAMKMSTWVSPSTGHLITPTYLDSNGWVKEDAALAVGGSYGGTFYGNVYAGTYALSFTGQASVSATMGTVSAVTYNATTNTSTATWTVTATQLSSTVSPELVFTNTKRLSGDAPGDGVTNVQLMMPTSVGSSTSFASTQLFTPGLLAEIENNGVSAIRTMAATGTVRATAVNWSDRTLPTYATQVKMFDSSGNQLSYLGNGLAWEYVIALANQTGKDVWINIQMSNNSQYITNLADLFKYGADASGNPYTSTQTNAVWAPLNKNQKIYLEFSNEVWNANFFDTQDNQANAATAVYDYLNSTGTLGATGAILDYDGVAGAYNSGTSTYAKQSILDDRLQALNLKNASDSFRAVYGDAAMGSLVRPVYAWQYSGDDLGGVDGNTGLGADGLDFLNNYFNNADVPAGGTNHVSTPHPVDYYVWGGGGAFYDGSADVSGTDTPTLSNTSFETVGNWTFTGSGGYAANGSFGTLTAPDGTHVASLPAGSTVGQNVQYTATEKQIASFYYAAAAGTSGTLSLTSNGVTVWSSSTFSTSAFTKVYSVPFSVTQNTSSVSLKFSFSGTGTAYVDAVDVAPLQNESFNDGLTGWSTVGSAAGAVSVIAGGVSGNPGATGTNAAALLTGGVISQTMNFSGGLTDIAFSATLARVSGTGTGTGKISLSIDGGAAVPLFEQSNFAVPTISTKSDGTANPFATEWTAAVSLTAGSHVISFSYADTAAVNRLFLDSVEIDSTNSMFGGWYTGGPIGAIYTVQGDTMIAKRYGLHSVAYEGGVSLGGDTQTPLQYASEQDSRMANLETWVLQNYYSLGGELPVFFESSGPSYGLVQSYTDANLTASGGDPKLAGYATAMSEAQAAIGSRTQKTATRFVWSSPGSLTGVPLTLYPRPQTVSVVNTTPPMIQYFVNVTTAGYYNVAASLDPSHAITANVSIDGALLGSITAGTGSSSGTYKVWMTAGLHNVEVLNTSLTTSGILDSLSVLAAT